MSGIIFLQELIEITTRKIVRLKRIERVIKVLRIFLDFSATKVIFI